MRRNYNEFRNVWFSWEDKISITIYGLPNPAGPKVRMAGEGKV